jgi:hypothetical protein
MSGCTRSVQVHTVSDHARWCVCSKVMACMGGWVFTHAASRHAHSKSVGTPDDSPNHEPRFSLATSASVEYSLSGRRESGCVGHAVPDDIVKQWPRPPTNTLSHQ